MRWKIILCGKVCFGDWNCLTPFWKWAEELGNGKSCYNSCKCSNECKEAFYLILDEMNKGG